jgi:undecaprenyl-diphosphatase
MSRPPPATGRKRPALPPHAGVPRWLNGHHPVSLAIALASVLLACGLFLDEAVHHWRGALDPALRHGFALPSRLGQADWSIVLAALMVAGFSRGAGRAGNGRNAVLWRQAAGQAGFVLATILTSGVAVNILKWGLGRARPNIAAADGAFTFAPIATSAGWASFPSGHAATTVALAVGLGFLMPRLRLGFLALALWVAASRAILGAHWASDVLAGVVLGAATAYALRRWYARRGLVFAWRHGAIQARTAGVARLLRQQTVLLLAGVAPAARRARAALRRLALQRRSWRVRPPD